MKNNALVLGIESSCDDTSVALMQGDQILYHHKYGQEELLKSWGGVVPELAARNHLQKMTPLLSDCFSKTQTSPKQLDLISVTTTPGLLGALLTGLNAAKTLSLLYQIPIIATNHLYAHLEAIHLCQKVSYPYLGLLISGGHSIYFYVKDKSTFKVLGSTIDDAAGEAFDKGGKLLGLGYPAGHVIDRLAKFGEIKKDIFPIGLKSSADARLSFSGLKTSLRVFLENNPEIISQKPKQFETKEDASSEFYNFCASYQQAISDALLLKLRYALKLAKEKYDAPKECAIVVGGGVACNSKIREDLKLKYPQALFVAPQFCTDNGAMIANYGRLNYEKAISFPDCLYLDSRGRFINKKDFV